KTGVTLNSSVEAFLALRGRLRAGEAGEFEKELPKQFEWRKEQAGWAIRPKKGGEPREPVERTSVCRGWEAGAALQATLGKALRSTVEILSGERVIALGLVVDADGWVLTKRTVLTGGAGPHRLACRLADGRRFEARVLAGSS